MIKPPPPELFISRYDRTSRLLPGVQSAEEAGDVFESLGLEIEHRTGARVLSGSRAIR